MPLRDIPARRHPLRWEQYSRLYDRLSGAADAFSDLGYPDLAAELSAVQARLSAAWDAIARAEQEGR
ncbi:hypothetical protein [Phaeospirillum tilakii]|uniref:Uncharacterized protein n=1 Tax=Phaeospirillum tilakii TaxID=741673 RepID=A0ABW5CDM7_9PROT